jgi:hypothetical protein
MDTFAKWVVVAAVVALALAILIWGGSDGPREGGPHYEWIGRRIVEAEA